MCHTLQRLYKHTLGKMARGLHPSVAHGCCLLCCSWSVRFEGQTFSFTFPDTRILLKVFTDCSHQPQSLITVLLRLVQFHSTHPYPHSCHTHMCFCA